MRRRRLVALFGGTALASPLAVPAWAGSPATCGVPVARDDGWPVVQPVVASSDALIDRAALCRMTDGLATSATANIHAVVVARDGRLVFERYLSGPDEIHDRRIRNVVFDAGLRHDMKSVSKSVASLVVGIAIDRGLIDSVDRPVFSFFPELADLRTPEKDRITLANVLTMTMGLAWVEATPATGNAANDEARMHRAADPCRYVLGLPVTAPAGQVFFYNTGALALLSAIVHRATGEPLDAFARTALFEPLGIGGVEWTRFKGDSDAGGGLRLRPREMAKIGQLVLDGGRWNGHQLVSRAWIEASTTPKIKATSGFSYGYLWWLGTTPIDGRAVPWIAALGRGGQSIRIVPSLDLVVAVTAGYYQDYSPEAFRLQFNVFRDVLKATPPR